MPKLGKELLHVHVLVLLGKHAGQRFVLGLRWRSRLRLRLRFGWYDRWRRHELAVVLLLFGGRLRIFGFLVILGILGILGILVIFVILAFLRLVFF